MTPVPTVHARGLGAVICCSSGYIPTDDDLWARNCRPARPAGVWKVLWAPKVWLVPRRESGELLICTSVRGDEGVALGNIVADRVFHSMLHGRELLSYASVLRLPICPRDPLDLPPDGTRCKLVLTSRWWPISIGFVPVAFSLVVTRHSDWGTAQYFIEAHIGHDYMKRNGVDRRDIYGSDLRHLRPLFDLHGSLEWFTSAIVNTMVDCAGPSGFLRPRGALLGVAEGVNVRDRLGRGFYVDDELVFDMNLPNSERRITTTAEYGPLRFSLGG